MAKFVSEIKYRLHFNTKEVKVFTLDEIIKGDLFFYTESMANKVVKYDLFSFYKDENDEDIFENDKVVVVSSNKGKLYETEVISSSKKYCKLAINKTIMIDMVSVGCVKKIIK